MIGLVELVNKDADHVEGQSCVACAEKPPPAKAPPVEDTKEDAAYISHVVGHGVRRRNSAYGFSKDDEKLLRMLCAHCCIFLKHLEAGD